LRCAFIKRGALEQFWRKHPDAQVGLESGYEIVRQAHWKTPAEMQRMWTLWDAAWFSTLPATVTG